MGVIKISSQDMGQVASLMANIKPEWWSVDSALAQLQGSMVWAYKAPNRLTAWISCRALPGYSTLELETMGYDEDGKMAVGPPLNPLLDQCANWVREHSYVNLRYTRSSGGLSCHGKQLGNLVQELTVLRSTPEARSYLWMLEQGFELSGILPDIYGPGSHGIILIKRLSAK